MLSAFLVKRMEVNTMEFNETNWKECLEALNFTEGKNESFGGMLVYDDKGIPQFDYDSEERKRSLFIFLSGALYMKNHMIYGQEVNTMIELKDLLEEGEVIVEYHLHNEYWSRNCITEKGSTDCSGALEMTLHRILEAGGTENDVYRIMGAKIPTDEELKDLEEFDEFVWIDLGYVLPGLIDMWEEKQKGWLISMTEYRYFKDSEGKICRLHLEQDTEPSNPRYDWDGNIGN